VRSLYFQSYPKKKHIQNALLSALKFVIPNNTFFSLRSEIQIGETTSKKQKNTNKQKIINSCTKIVIKVTFQKLFSSKEKKKRKCNNNNIHSFTKAKGTLLYLMMFCRKSFRADGSLSLTHQFPSASQNFLQHQHLMIALNSADAKVGTQQKTEKKRRLWVCDFTRNK
jgi:hypothetical protein